MVATRFLWLVDLTPAGDAAGHLAAELPDGVGLEPIAVEGVWTGPEMARPFGIAVVSSGRGVQSCAGVLRQLRLRSPLPILVVIEGATAEQQHLLMRSGATGVVRPPWDPSASEGSKARIRLRFNRTLELMTEVGQARQVEPKTSSGIQLIAIGSSTGGPDVLRHILCGDRPFRVPVVIAQHVTRGFDTSLAEWLTNSGQPCTVAQVGESPQPGHALLAPATQDLVLKDGVCELLEPVDAVVPSADRLLASVADAFGRAAVGFVLTGMGRDGAKGLLALQASGGFTVTQRGDTCVVDGMPASARSLNAHCQDWTPDEIRDYLNGLRT